MDRHLIFSVGVVVVVCVRSSGGVNEFFTTARVILSRAGYSVHVCFRR